MPVIVVPWKPPFRVCRSGFTRWWPRQSVERDGDGCSSCCLSSLSPELLQLSLLRPSGGGSRSGLSGVGGTSASSRFVHFGAFVLTVPKGFHVWESWIGPKSKPTLGAFLVANHHPRALSTGTLLPASAVYLSV